MFMFILYILYIIVLGGEGGRRHPLIQPSPHHQPPTPNPTTTPPKPNQTNQAHYIKTRSTSTAKAVFALTSLNKWCLTGTPLQNRVGELYSLVRFLRMDPHAYYFCRCVLVLLCFVFVGWELGVLGVRV